VEFTGDGGLKDWVVEDLNDEALCAKIDQQEDNMYLVNESLMNRVSYRGTRALRGPAPSDRLESFRHQSRVP
jgi:hypothetical protein